MRVAICVLALVLASTPVGATGPGGGQGGGARPEVGRLAGADRVGTAVEVAYAAFPDGAARVYLARADGFADALVAGSLTDGPILLVPGCGDVPPSVSDVIDVQSPSEVVAIGGPAAVCEELLQAAAAGRDTARLAGPDRFATASAVARAAFPDGAGVVYLASAVQPADAVSGGSLTDGPLLLVPTEGEVPSAVHEAIADLAADEVVALGGTAAVSQEVLEGAAAGRPTMRVAGDDRFATSAAVSARQFPDGAPTAYLARADVVADALAAGTLRDGPTLLVPRDGVLPVSVQAEIDRLQPGRVVALGGTAAVSDEVLAQGVGAPACGAPYPRPGVPLVEDVRTSATPLWVRPPGTPPIPTATVPAVSGDGSLMVFSAVRRSYDPDDLTGRRGIYVQPAAGGAVRRIDVAVDGGEPNGNAVSPTISGDGSRIAFWSDATNLVHDGPERSQWDLYVVEIDGTPVRRIPLGETDFTADPFFPAGGIAYLQPDLDRDGSTVVFTTTALYANEHGLGSTYRVELPHGSPELVTVRPDGSPAIGGFAATDDAGDVVIFFSQDDALAGEAAQPSGHIYVRDMATQTTRRMSEPGDVAFGDPTISGDGATVAYGYGAQYSGGGGAVWVHDLATEVRRLVSEFAAEPTIAADGGSVVQFEESDLVIRDIDGTVLRRIPGARGDSRVLAADDALATVVVHRHEGVAVVDTTTGSLRTVEALTDSGADGFTSLSDITDEGLVVVGDVLVDPRVPWARRDLPQFGTVSGDGGTLSYNDGETPEYGYSPEPGRIIALDLTTGEQRTVTSPDEVSRTFQPSVSDDGRTVAYLPHHEEGASTSVVVATAGGDRRTFELGALVTGLVMSGDGSTVLVQTEGAGVALHVIDVPSGEVALLADEGAGTPVLVGARSISDDGRVAVIGHTQMPAYSPPPGRLSVVDLTTGETTALREEVTLDGIDVDDSGRWVSYIEPADSEFLPGVAYVEDLTTGERVPLGDPSATPAQGTGQVVMSGDGRCLGMVTHQSSLIPGDVNENADTVILPNPLLT